MNLFAKQTQNLENEVMVARGKDGGRDSQGVWDGHEHTAIFKMDNQKVILYNTENYDQCYVTAWMGREFRENGYMYI